MVGETPILPRFCRRCGHRFESTSAAFCTSCGMRWSDDPPSDTAEALVRTLEELRRWRSTGLLGETNYSSLSSDLLARLERLAPAPAPSIAGVSAAPVAPGPPPPPAVPRISFRQWASARQADLLLYLGAFLLVVAALVFVGGRGDGLSPLARLSVLGAYTIAFCVAGLLVPRWERVREAGPVFLALGSLLAPLNILYWYTEILSEQGVPADWVWLFGSIASTALYGALYLRGMGSLYRIPAGIAALNAWEALFAISDADAAWLGAWHMLLAVLFAAAGARFRILTNGLVATVASTATIALGGALLAATATDDAPAQLPLTFALLTAALAIVGVHRGWPALLPATAASATATTMALLWALEVDDPWLLYPPVILGALTLATRSRWAPRSEWLAGFGWLFATGAALVPLLAREDIDREWHGAALMLLGALVAAAVAWLDTRQSVTAWLHVASAEVEEPTPAAERVAFGWLAFTLLLVAVFDASAAAGLRPPDTAWPYLATATAVALALGRFAPSRPGAAALALTPPFLSAVALAVQPWDRWPGHDATILGVAAAELLVCAALARGWPLGAIGSALAGAALAATWEHFAWPSWSLGVTYAAIGGAWFVATARWRHYRATTDAETYDQLALLAVPVGFGAVAFVAALQDATIIPVEVAAQTAWYRTSAALVLGSAVAFLYEARRLRAPAVTLPAAPLIALAAALAWPIVDLPRLWLAPAYAFAGVGLLLALARWRRGADTPAAWTWGYLALGILVAISTLPDTTAARPLVHTPEYRVFVALLFLAAAAVAFEARRLHSTYGLLGASALTMVATLFAIAITEPANVQWYTVPAAVYLLAVGLLLGRTPRPLSPHISIHEVVLVAGSLALVLPPAEQSFEPSGGLWGLLVLLEGGVLLAVGLVLVERWLATAGVLAISGVAIRWLFEVGQTLPYWLTLGIAGMVLLTLGLLLLFQREWWERAITTLGEWWRRPSARGTT